MGQMRIVSVAAVLAATALAATACSGGGGGGDATGGGGETIEIVGSPSGSNGDALAADLAVIAEQTGIDIEYTPLPDFDTVIRSRVEGGNPPDLAIFPQPGLILDLGNEGDLVPMGDIVDVEALTADVIPGLVDTTTADDGSVYALPYSFNVKSLVWYPKQAFEDAGYEVPTTHAELVALAEQIKNDGIAPWCFGIEAAAATGWPATDWIEEYVLRIGGPEVYDQWVSHEIPFNDPVVVEAAEMFQSDVLAEGNAFGGTNYITATNFGEAANPMFTDPPGCMLHRQANFITEFWPDEVTQNLSDNVGVFLFPPVETGWDGGQPILGGGDFVGAFTNNEDVKTVLEAMSSPDFGIELPKTGGWLSPWTTFDTSKYPNEILALQAELAANADAYRFDGSDLMPGQVGTGTFWTEMTSWISGGEDLETALQNIEDSWPTS